MPCVSKLERGSCLHADAAKAKPLSSGNVLFWGMVLVASGILYFLMFVGLCWALKQSCLKVSSKNKLRASCEPHPVSVGQGVPSPMVSSSTGQPGTAESSAVPAWKQMQMEPRDKLIHVDMNSVFQGSGRILFLSVIHLIVFKQKVRYFPTSCKHCLQLLPTLSVCLLY